MSLLLGPNQISRHIGDNQLLSAAVQNPGNLQGPQEGDAVPQCEMADKVRVQELASCCHKWAVSQGRSSFYRQCQVQGQSFGVERGTESPIKWAPRGFSSTQDALGLSFTPQYLCPILVIHSLNK